MQRTRFLQTTCPIARGLEHVGEWWSMLILHHALRGVTRFDQFQKRLGVAPNMLTRRLNALVDGGLMARRRYCDHPPRDEYLLTEAGREFAPVLAAMQVWSRKHFPSDPPPSTAYLDVRTGARVDPVVVDRHTGAVFDPDVHVYGSLDPASPYALPHLIEAVAAPDGPAATDAAPNAPSPASRPAPEPVPLKRPSRRRQP